MNSNREILLGVNIDHIATLRQARLTDYPSPLQGAMLAEEAGADGITVHLREDRRHIQESDVIAIQQHCLTRLNLEMAVTDAMINFALYVKPAHVCFVPENREELTTEGGLDVLGQQEKINDAVKSLQEQGTEVSLFIDPTLKQIEAAVKAQAKAVEIHTGAYADAFMTSEQQREYQRIAAAAGVAREAGLIVNAGHGLHYHNVKAIAAIKEINELNIGHAIIARALMTGIKEAVSTMKQLMIMSRVELSTDINNSL